VNGTWQELCNGSMLVLACRPRLIQYCSDLARVGVGNDTKGATAVSDTAPRADVCGDTGCPMHAIFWLIAKPGSGDTVMESASMVVWWPRYGGRVHQIQSSPLHPLSRRQFRCGSSAANSASSKSWAAVPRRLQPTMASQSLCTHHAVRWP